MNRSLTLRYSLIQFCFWVCFASVIAFSSYFLLDRGLSNTAVGVILAVSGLLSVLFSPVMGALMDDHPKLTSPKMTAALASLLTVGAAFLLLPQRRPLMTGMIYGLLVLLLYLAQSVLNILGVDSMANGNRINFNLGRSFGSFGYAAAAWAIGLLTGFLSPSVIPVTVMVSAAVIAVASFTYPIRTASGDGTASAADTASGSRAFLKNYPRFLLLLPALVLIYFGHTVINTFTLQILMPIGGGSKELGTATAIAAVCELIMILLFARCMKHFPLRTLLRVSGVFFTLKTLGSLLAGSVQAYYAVQLLQTFGWGIMCVGLVHYVNETVDRKDRARGQSRAGMTLTAASVIGSVLGGRIIDTAGVRSLLVLGTAVCACGSILMFFATRRSLPDKDAGHPQKP